MINSHYLLQVSSAVFSKKLPFASPLPLLLRSQSRRLFSKMATVSQSHPLTHSITLPCQPDQPVQVVAATGISDSDFRNAIDSSLFKQWLENLQSETGALATGSLCLKTVLIQGVDMFGKRIGFLKFKADILDKETGKMIPGIVFARGPAVAILILLDSGDETYAVLTEQVRVPVGKVVLELPAGMLDDDSGDFLGTAVREVEEEIGLNLNKEDMIDLTALLDPSTGGKIFPSPGGCDEGLNVFLYRGRVDKDTIAQLRGKQTGLRDHGELITVRVVPYRGLWQLTTDAKVFMAIALHEMASRVGLLPPSTI